MRNREPITVLAVGGTGESYCGDERTQVTGMLAAVTDALDERFVARWVPYPASYGPAPEPGGVCYLESVSAGVTNLSHAIAAADGPVMVIGYSQGAVVIRALLSHPAAAQLLPKVAAVGFIADPHQPPGVVRGCDGWGVAGAGPDLPGEIPAYWVGDPHDMICNASADSLLRDVADLTPTLSGRQTRLWLTDVYARVASRRMQNAAKTRIGPSQWRRDVRRLANARREVLGYLPRAVQIGGFGLQNGSGGRHVSYGTEPYRMAPLTDPDTTGCEDLAHWMQVQATLGVSAVA
ncbi:MAG: PE-PPE domain-containing protein [Gordonia sp. (in: high G+C Gram-positive bacteria)]